MCRLGTLKIINENLMEKEELCWAIVVERMVFRENKDRKRKMGLQGVDIIENVTFTFHISKEVAAMFFSNCLGPKIMKTSIERHN